MNSRYENLRADLRRAVAKLADALAQPKSEFLRDSSIQRFEFTYELVWKTLKAYLSQHHGIEVYSPKDVLREAFRQSLIDDDPLWLRSVELRNLTTHNLPRVHRRRHLLGPARYSAALPGIARQARGLSAASNPAPRTP